MTSNVRAQAQPARPTAPVGKLEREDPDSERRVALAKVQVVLDRAKFRPGKIDGLGGEFTQKAAARYNLANGLDEWAVIDTSHIDSPYREYEVTEVDLEWIGRTASTPSAQAQLSRMPYSDAWEMVAEKFHCDLNFLRELNPDLANTQIVVGTKFRVPDVEPFSMGDVTALEKERAAEAKRKKAEEEATTAESKPTPTSETTPAATTDPEIATSPTPASDPATQSVDFLYGQPDSSTPQSGDSVAMSTPASVPTPEPAPEPIEAKIVILRDPRLIELYENDKLVACYPCTPGSGRVPVPVGTWRITSNVLMPYFRYDKSVLRDGTRSENAFNIPPGPNNYVGIVWMGINRRSVGLHGTQSPDQIGRNESSGCIRLANWDAFDLCQRAPKGTAVEVR